MLDNIRLSDLPPYGKLFVAIFTSLMLLVVFWAVFIFYVSKGMVDTDHLPAYLTEESEDVSPADSGQADLQRQEDAEVIEGDSLAVLAPVWDSTFAGREADVDSVTNIDRFRARDSEMALDEARDQGEYTYVEYGETPFRHNLGLAHTHVNGQTLLYFAMGLVFLFTSVPAKIKKIVYWVFGVSVLVHAVGLTGQGYYGIFDDMLAVSGVALLVIIVYMALLIYVDLGRSRSSINEGAGKTANE